MNTNSTIFRINHIYLLITFLLFAIEVIIAVFVHDNFVRPYVGDVLVVILIYCFLLSFLNLPTSKTALAVLLFAFLVEWLQYLSIVKFLGLENNTVAKIIIGTSFAWEDLLAYVVGIGIVLFFEMKLNRSKKTN